MLTKSNNKYFTFGVLFLFVCFTTQGQNNFLDSLFQKNLFGSQLEVLNSANDYRLQIIYTKINRVTKDSVSFQDFYFNYSDTLYNYPASMVKLPIAVASVKKIEAINNPGINLNSYVCMDSLFCQKPYYTDSSAYPQYPHLNLWIKKMLVLSDNESFTHAYDFLNCKTIHVCLNDWKFSKAQIKNKFIYKCINDSTFYTPNVYIINQHDTIFKQQQEAICKFDSLKKNYIVGYNQEIIKKKVKKRTIRIKKLTPKNFSYHNDWTLNYSHQLMKDLIFDSQLKVLNLSSAHRDSLIKYMGKYPRECPELKADTNAYYDTWKKFFIYGAKYKRIRTDSLRNINIIGRAYGFLSETAYIADFKNNVEFILSAVIYVNKNNIMDGKYEYDEIAAPLFQSISLAIYNYEKQRKKNKPNTNMYEKLFH